MLCIISSKGFASCGSSLRLINSLWYTPHPFNCNCVGDGTGESWFLIWVEVGLWMRAKMRRSLSAGHRWDNNVDRNGLNVYYLGWFLTLTYFYEYCVLRLIKTNRPNFPESPKRAFKYDWGAGHITHVDLLLLKSGLRHNNYSLYHNFTG